MPTAKAEVTNVYIKVNGRDLSTDLMSKLKDVVVESALGYPDTFTIAFNDETVAFIDDSINQFQPGHPIKISFFAYGGNAAIEVFDGEITTISPEFDAGYGATLVVSGYDKRHRLMRGTQNRTFLKMTDSDIVSRIAREYSLSPSVDATSEQREHVTQDNQTNMEFLEELAKRNAYQVYVKGSRLHFKKPTHEDSQVTLTWGQNLIAFRARLSAARQVNEVIVRGWDSDQQKPIEGSVKSSKTAPKTAIQSGYDLAKKFGTAKRIEVKQPVASAKEAKNVAQAIFDKINSESIEAEGLADGNPDIVAGVSVKIEKVGSTFSGIYHVTSVKHFLEGSLYKTEFVVEGTSPYLLGGLLDNNNNHSSQTYPVWSGVYPAIVTNNTDPDKLNRVKLNYPWLDDSVESHWARVVTVGAGKEMGTHWLPEIDDEVLVAFEHGNFNHPYVIGGVYSQKLKPPPESQEGKAIDKRVMKSRSGHMIIMDDTQGSEKITIETSKGHLLSMDDAGKSIEFKTSGKKFIKIDDQGNKISIEGATTVDIKSTNAINIEGTSVTIKGKGTVKVEAPQVDVNGSAMVKIAGGMIQIG